MMNGISGVTPYQGIMRADAYVGMSKDASQLYAAEKMDAMSGRGVKLQLFGEGTLPVQPVRPIGAPVPHTAKGVDLAQKLRQGADPAEMAVRMRMEYANGVKGAENMQNQPVNEKQGAEEECQTCENRRYQDGSDDPGVSYKVPTKVSKEMAMSEVRRHEMEHVVREQAKAEREERKVVSQHVSIHTGICPECGDVYVSGGTTHTVTVANPKEEPTEQNLIQNDMESVFDKAVPKKPEEEKILGGFFSAVA